MREILFRGKRADNGKWVYGYYWNRGEVAHYIKVIDESGNLVGDYEIIPETVGEYTGLTDKNGKEVFEGDLIRCVSEEQIVEVCTGEYMDIISLVLYVGVFLKIKNDICSAGQLKQYKDDFEVVGNIHETLDKK